MEPESGSSAVEWVSILLAGGAFFVSIASLWLTSLRRAHVVVQAVEQDELIGDWTWDGPMPSSKRVHLPLFIANTGSSGTVVESLALTEYRELRSGGDPLYQLGRGQEQAEPIVLERDDAKAGQMWRALEFVTDPPIPDAEHVAQRLRGLDAMLLVIEWTYRRAPVLRPTKDKRIAGRTVVWVPGGMVRDPHVNYWRTQPAWKRLADIAEGIAPRA